MCSGTRIGLEQVSYCGMAHMFRILPGNPEETRFQDLELFDRRWQAVGRFIKKWSKFQKQLPFRYPNLSLKITFSS
jgi:hypothetical protein